MASMTIPIDHPWARELEAGVEESHYDDAVRAVELLTQARDLIVQAVVLALPAAEVVSGLMPHIVIDDRPVPGDDFVDAFHRSTAVGQVSELLFSIGQIVDNDELDAPLSLV